MVNSTERKSCENVFLLTANEREAMSKCAKNNKETARNSQYMYSNNKSG